MPSLIHCNIFLERIMTCNLEERGGKFRWQINDLDALAEEEQDIEVQADSLDKICTMYKMEISADQPELMTNSANGIQRVISVKGQMLGIVTSFICLGAIVSDDGLKQKFFKDFKAKIAKIKLPPNTCMCF